MEYPVDISSTTHETDVLVLGAGASGCGAALAAGGRGVRVLLADSWRAAVRSAAAMIISWPC